MAEVTVKRNGAFCEFHLHGACIWSVNIAAISSHQELAAVLVGLADDFTWFQGDVLREFERMVEQRLNKF